MFTIFEDILNAISPKKSILIIITVGIVVYYNLLSNGFVWDDLDQLVNNPKTLSVSNVLYFFSGSTFENANHLIGVYYRPLVTTVLSAIYTFVGPNAFFYHLFQVAIHIANSVILFLLFITLFNKIHINELKKVKENEWQSFSGSQKIKYLRVHGSPPQPSETPDTKIIILSLFLALIFLVHPINTEVVDYISALGDTMVVFFGLVAVYILVITRLRKFWNHAIICALFFLSFLSKEAGILFIVASLTYTLVFLRKKFTSFLIASSIVVTIYLFIRLIIGNLGAVVNSPISQGDLFFRLLSLPKILWYYLKTFFFPKELIIYQIWVVKSVSLDDFIIPLLIVATIFGCIVFLWFTLWKRKSLYRDLYLFFMCWFFLGLALYSQVIPLDMTVADRWFYFPIVGLLGLIGLGFMIISSFNTPRVILRINKKVLSLAFIFFGILIVIGLSVRTIIRTANFHDLMTLYTHDSKLQHNPLLEKDLENQYVKDRKFAFKYLQKLAVENPSPTILFDLGNLYEFEGRLQEAGDYYFKAVSAVQKYYKTGEMHNPNDERIYIRLSGLLLLSQKYEYASNISSEGLRNFPGSGTMWSEFAIAKAKLKQWDEAIKSVEQAKRINSYDQITLLIYQLVSNKQDVPLPIVTMLMNKEIPTLLLGK